MDRQEKESRGLNLLKRSKRGFWRMVFSRTGVVTVLLLLQIAVFLLALLRFEEFQTQMLGGSALIGAAMTVHILNNRQDPASRSSWIVLVLFLPVFGSLLYLYTQLELGQGAMKAALRQQEKRTGDRLTQDGETFCTLQEESPEMTALTHYLNRSGCYPVYRGTACTYFPSGEAKFEALLQQLEGAQDFIFLEYFIVEEGEMWGRVLEILARKAREGVQVRLLYDGTCEFSLLPRSYPQKLQKLGIECRVFSPMLPFLSTHYNYRDHRKIVVIDGKIAFTGGINLADEYINRYPKHGHWKDTAVMLQGPAVESFTLMFLKMWNLSGPRSAYEPYLQPVPPVEGAEGFVLPYGDCPLDEEWAAQRVYMDILNRAQDYVYIMTPYLILDSALETALKFAAERGVDVRLVLPGIPDKKTPYALAKSHYPALLRSGVKIYEYTPGFVHGKVFLADGQRAVVGTVNLDYRSLQHHFECAAYLYRCGCLEDIRRDFEETFLHCRRVTEQTLKENAGYIMLGRCLKLFAPLL